MGQRMGEYGTKNGRIWDKEWEKSISIVLWPEVLTVEVAETLFECV